MQFTLYAIFTTNSETATIEFKVFNSDEAALDYINQNYPDLEEGQFSIERIDKVENFQVFVKYAGDLQ
jgi:hypothetical protein